MGRRREHDVLAALWALAFAFQIASTIDVQGQFRRASEGAQNRIHATAWHLQQLLPRAGADAPRPHLGR